MGNRAVIIGICMGLLFSGALFLAAPGAAQQAKTIKIGALVGLSGWFSPIEGTDVADLINMAKIINERAGSRSKARNTTWRS